MGEYARLYILRHHGVDIGGDDDEPPRKPYAERKPFACHCGRRFTKQHALNQHREDYHKIPRDMQEADHGN